MSIFAIDPEQQKADAEQRLKTAETLLGLAEKACAKDPSRENDIIWKAAKRLYQETGSQLEEWS